MTPKRVKAIAAEKKRDHMITGNRAAGTVDGAAVEFVNLRLDGLPRGYLWSPSWMPPRNKPTPFARVASRVHHTSFAEKMSIDIPCNIAVNHRRIVFRTGYEDLRANCGRKEQVDGADAYDTLRNFTENPLTDFSSMFQGVEKVDWWQWVKAPIDRKKVIVMYDKLFVYNPAGPNGGQIQKKFYHKVNKWYDFPDVEAGGDINKIPTSWPGIRSEKVFVLDIFESSRDTRDVQRYPLGEQYMSVSLDTTNYWTEP